MRRSHPAGGNACVERSETTGLRCRNAPECRKLKLAFGPAAASGASAKSSSSSFLLPSQTSEPESLPSPRSRASLPFSSCPDSAWETPGKLLRMRHASASASQERTIGWALDCDWLSPVKLGNMPLLGSLGARAACVEDYLMRERGRMPYSTCLGKPSSPMPRRDPLHNRVDRMFRVSASRTRLYSSPLVGELVPTLFELGLQTE